MLKVVLIDDEYWTLKGLTCIIDWQAENCEIIGTFQDAEEAENFCLNHPEIDLIITDIRMGSVLGLDLIKRLKEHLPDTYYALISGYTDFAYAKSAIQLGVSEYFEKPINRDELLNFLARIKNEVPVKTTHPAQNYRKPIEENNDDISIDELSAKEIIPQVMQYIRDNYKEDLSLSSLSIKFGLSEKYLSSLFKKTSEITISQYLKTVRIDKAKEFLTTTSINLQRISFLCGYNDYFYFTKVFKKAMGITPRQYRDIHRPSSKNNNFEV